MKYRIKNNTKNIGKRDVFCNKVITIKLYDGLIEKQININPGEYLDIKQDGYYLPTNVLELEKKGLLNISLVYDVVVKPVVNKSNDEPLAVLSTEIKPQKNHTKKKNNK